MAKKFWLRRLCGGSGPDVTAPTITSTNTFSINEGEPLAKVLTANETVIWSIVGGADAADYELAPDGFTLRWAGNGTQNYEDPADLDANNTYIVTVRATDGAGLTADQTITGTVLNVTEGLTPSAGGTFTDGAVYLVGYDDTVTIEGGTPYTNGTPPYRIAVTSGTLPTGLSASIDMDGKARINGVPTASGSFTGLLTVTDAGSNSTDIAFNIPVPTMPTALTISFGALTRGRFGKHALGNAAGGPLTILSGNGAGHFQIVDNKLTVAGANDAAPPGFSGPYTLTISNGTTTQTTTINILPNVADIASNAADASGANELNSMLTVTTKVGLGQTIRIRDGSHFNPTSALWYLQPPSPTGAWSGVSTSFVKIASEWEDVSVDDKGRPNRKHGAKISFIRWNMGGANDFRVPFLFSKIWAQFTGTAPTDGTTIFQYTTDRGYGVSYEDCRFDSSAAVTTPRNVAAAWLRSSASIPAHFSRNTVTTGGQGVVIRGNASTAPGGRAVATLIDDNDFIRMRRDCVRVYGDIGTTVLGSEGEVITGNLFVEPLLDTGGDHQDQIQHFGNVGSSTTTQAGVYSNNYLLATGTDPAWPQGIFIDDTTGTARIANIVVENNFILAGVQNAIWLLLNNSPVVRCNTVIRDLNFSGGGLQTPTIVTVAEGAEAGSGGTFTHNITNAISVGSQSGTVTSTPNTVLAINGTAYNNCFAAFTSAPVNRAQAKAMALALMDGTAKNGDGTYNGRWFPDGSENDRTVFVP